MINVKAKSVRPASQPEPAKKRGFNPIKQVKSALTVIKIKEFIDEAQSLINSRIKGGEQFMAIDDFCDVISSLLVKYGLDPLTEQDRQEVRNDPMKLVFNRLGVGDDYEQYAGLLKSVTNKE